VAIANLVRMLHMHTETQLLGRGANEQHLDSPCTSNGSFWMVVRVPWEGTSHTWSQSPWSWSTPHPCTPLGQLAWVCANERGRQGWTQANANTVRVGILSMLVGLWC